MVSGFHRNTGDRLLGPRLPVILALTAALTLGALTLLAPAGSAQDLEDVRPGGVEPGDCLVVAADPDALVDHLPVDELPDQGNASQAPLETVLEEAQDPASVPIVCQEPMNGTMRELVRQGNHLVGQTEVLRQQVSATADEVEGTAEIPFLFENFTAERVGGLGNWTTSEASEAGFVRPQHASLGDGYALTRSPGESYPAGMNAALVSPAIDLGGTLVQPSMTKLPDRVRAVGEALLDPRPPASPSGEGSSVDVCLGGSGTSCIVEDAYGAGGRQAYQAIRQAYLDTAENITERAQSDELAVMLEVRHRFNLAAGLDGVRYEVLAEPPSPGSIPEGTPITPQNAGDASYGDTAAGGGQPAFTGTTGWTTHRFDVTDWAGQRIWIVARAETVPGFFQDAVEDRLADEPIEGYALDGAFVNATVAPRNLRVLEIDAGQQHVDGNWTLPPPLGDHVAEVAVTNQGINATRADVRLDVCTPHTCRTEATFSEVPLQPGEVRTLPVYLVSVGAETVELRATIVDSDRAEDAADADRDDNRLTRTIDLETVERIEVEPDSDTGRGLSVDPRQGEPDDPRTVELRVENAGNVPVERTIDLTLVDTADGRPASGAVEQPTRSFSLEPGHATTLTWTLTPPGEGVYRVLVPGLSSSEDRAGPEPAALVYTDRSPGVVCADDTHRLRACGHVWEDIAGLPRVDDDERIRANEIRSAAVTPEGLPLALHEDGGVLAFDDGAWTRIHDDNDLRWLVHDGSTTLAIGEDGDTTLLGPGGPLGSRSTGLDEVHTVAVHGEAGILVAGEGDEPVDVARWEGLSWSLLPNPRVDEDAHLADLTLAADGTPLLAVLEPNGTVDGATTRYDVRVCRGSPGGDSPFRCTELDEPEDRDPIPATRQLGDRRPSVQAGTADGQLVLLVEAPEATGPNSSCSTSPSPGEACLLRLPGASGDAELERPNERRLLEPGTTSEGALALTFQDLASVTWVRHAETPDPDRLRRLSSSISDRGFQVAGLPAGGPVSPLGGGPDTAALVAGSHLVAAQPDGPEPSLGNGWHPHERLLPQTADRVITTVQPAGVGEGAEAASAHGPDQDVFLRASCSDASVGELFARARTVAGYADQPPTDDRLGDDACLEIDPLPLGIRLKPWRQPDRLEEDTRRILDSDDELDLDVRYNLRELGRAEPEVRLVLQPLQKPHHEGIHSVPASPDLEGELVSTGGVENLYPMLEEQTNRLLGCLAGGPSLVAACDISGTTGGFLQGEIDETDRLDLPDQGVRSPHVVAVGEFERTGHTWEETRIDLAEELREKGLDRQSWRLLGVEFAFPEGTQMALDAAWLNRTDAKDHEVLLFTNGRDANGTWKRSVVADRTASANFLFPVVSHALGETVRIAFECRPSNPSGCEPAPPPDEASAGQRDIRDRQEGFPVVQTTPYASTFTDEGERREVTPAGPEPGTPSWGLTNVTSRPAWAFMAPEPYRSSTPQPVADRLVTPVVDLRDAERPTFTFSHAYAFNEEEGMGWVEAQVETEPGEWSEWFRLRPEDGYTDEDEGDGDVPRAYHGASLETDRNGTWRPVLDAGRWETASFNLIDQRRPLDGHRVRFAFHAVFEESPSADQDRRYEGWVVSDLRLEADRPAVDLALEDAHVDEPFEATKTGLPPGDPVEVNVTIENEGTQPSGPRRLSWEVVGVGSHQDVIERGVRPLPSLDEDERTWVSFSLPVPSLDELAPLGIDENSGGVSVRMELGTVEAPDEDPTDDRLEMGSPTHPFRVREDRDVELRLQVHPQDGPVHRTRTVETIVNNTGNTPLTGIEVHRAVEAQLGIRSQMIPGVFEPVTTSRPLPAGEEKRLSSLTPEIGTEDVFWQPPQIGSYIVRANAFADDVTANGQARATASEAALFSSVEEPPRGEATDGNFHPGDGWEAAGPGAFRSAQAFHLQPDDIDITREGANLSLTLPPVDLTNYRRAELSFAHRYDFEPAFDGGAVQVSADGGETWSSLHPVETGSDDDGLDRFDATASAGGHGPVIGVSPLTEGNLSTAAFTGNTSDDGQGRWTSSRFDISQLDRLREPGEVANWSLEDMRGNSTREIPAPPAEDAPKHVYAHPAWSRGSTPVDEGFLVENRTKRHSPDGEDVLYTGSAHEMFQSRRSDDRSGNHLATYDIDLLEPEDPATEVHLIWEEWGPLGGRVDTGTGLASTSDAIPFARALWSSTSPAEGCMDPTLQPHLLSVDGKTRRYMADVTTLAHREDVSTVSLGFMTHPWFENAEGEWTWGLTDAHVSGYSKDHPGFAVENIEVTSFRRSPAGPVGVATEEISLSSASHAELPKEDHSFDPTEGRCPSPAGGGSSDVFRLTDETTPVNTTWYTAELGGDGDEETTVLSASAPREHPTGTVWDAPELGDSRLVLPPLHLSSGENVTLTFDHVPAFGMQQRRGCDNGQLGGGVLEVSVYDSGENQWGEWQQLYSEPGAMGPHEAGGYDAGHPIVAHEIRPLDDGSSPGCLTTFPFELHEGQAADGTPLKRPYLYNTCIAERNETNTEDFDACSGLVDPGPSETWEEVNVVQDWRSERFDLSNLTGKRVRLAFHAFFLPDCDYETVYEPSPGWSGDAAPDHPGAQPRDSSGDFTANHRGCPTDGSRWLIDNVTVEGEAFRGEPLQLRFEAGMDGSVHNASWSIDEIGIVGERYDKNVGLYLDDDRPEDIAPGETITIEGELRNMGTQLRRDLVVKAHLEDLPGEASVSLGDTSLVQGSGEVASRPVTLDAARSAPVHVEVTASSSLTTDDDPKIRLEVVRLSELLGTHTRPDGEAVTTNLDRIVDLEPRGGELHLGEPEAELGRVPTGKTTSVHLPLDDPSLEPTRVAVECTLVRVQSWLPVDHGVQANHSQPVATPEGSCSPASQTLALEGRSVEPEFQVTLPREGVYEARFEVQDLLNDRELGTRSVDVWAGQAPRLHFTNFTDDGEPALAGWGSSSRSTGDDNHGGDPSAAQATDEDAWHGNASARIGISRDTYERGETYFTEQASRLLSPPIDLHNLTDSEGYLTFYHMGRFAYGDGADVKVRVQANERGGGWTDWCKLHPVEGYEGFVASYRARGTERNTDIDMEEPASSQPGVDPQETSHDFNPAFEEPPTLGINRKHGFYGSTETVDGQPVPRWDESWQLASFPLAEDPETGQPLTCGGQPVLGRTAQFAFTLYAGEADDDPPEEPGANPDPLDRGRGQAWYVDSVVVSTGNTTQSPRKVTVPLLDEAPKKLPVRVENNGPLAELGTVQTDPSNTTIRDSQLALGEDFVIPARNTSVETLGVEMPRNRLALSFQHHVSVQPGDLIDPNQRPETSFELPFQPRTWGDLSVTIREPEDAVVEAVPALVPVEVTNDGLDRSPPTDLAVRIGSGEEAREITASVPSLPPAQDEPREATTEVFVPWTPEQGSTGEHDVTAHVDPDGELEEYTKADNADTRTIDVQPLRIPDLGFVEEELTVEGVDADIRVQADGTLQTYSIPSGSLVRVSVPVENTGNAAATLIDVRLFYGSLALPAERIDRLAPGGSQDVAFTFVATDDTRRLSLEVTSGARDLDPTDNAAPTQGTIRLEGLSFDIGVSVEEPVQLADPGEDAQTRLNLTNRAGVGVLVELAADPPAGIDVNLDARQLFLEPGRTTTVGAEILTEPGASGGTHPIGLEILEIGNGTNAVQASLPVHIEPTHALDLSTSAQTLAPGTTALPVTLTNDGNMDERIELTAQLAGTNVSTPIQTTVPRDLPRSLELDVTLPPGATAGNHQLTINAEGTTSETWTRTVEIPARPHLELRPDPGRATLAPEGLHVPIHTTNAGTAPLSARLIPDPLAAPDGTHLDPDHLELAPGEARNVSLVAPATTTEPIPLTVDGPQGGELTVPVPGAETDLVLLRQTVAPEEPEPGTPIELRATVANTGQAPVHEVPVDLFIDEEFASRVTIDKLTGGDSATVTFEWPAFAGEHLVSTVVDPDGSFPDTQPDNDRANLHLTAGDAGLLGQLLQIPGPGAWLIPIVALTAALVPRIRSPRRGGET